MIRSVSWFCAPPMALLWLVGCAQSESPSQAPDIVASADEPPAFECRPDITAAQCAQARESLLRDAEVLADEFAVQGPTLEARQREIEASLPSPAEMMSAECREQAALLAALARMQNPGPGEIVSPEEKASIPVQTERIKRYIESNCR